MTAKEKYVPEIGDLSIAFSGLEDSLYIVVSKNVNDTDKYDNMVLVFIIKTREFRYWVVSLCQNDKLISR